MRDSPPPGIQDERPNEDCNIDSTVALDDIALARDVFDKLCWKEGNEPPSNKVWGEFLQHNHSHAFYTDSFVNRAQSLDFAS